MRDSLEQARLSVNLANSAFSPKVVPNIFGSFGQSDNANQTYKVDFSQRLTTGTELRATLGTASSKNQLGTFYTTDTAFFVRQPILRGFGRNNARRELFRTQSRVEEQIRSQSIVEQQLTVEVAAAYYGIVSQRLMADVAEKTLERSLQLLEASQAKLEAGRVSQLDVYRAQQLAADAETELLDSRASVEDAKDQLRYLIGQELDYDFAVEQEIPLVAEPLTADEAVATALENRLEILNSRQVLAEAERTMAYSKNQLLPQFDINIGFARQETAESFRTSFGVDNFKLTTFFSTSMPVDRTPQRVAYHSAIIDRDRRRRAVENLERRIAAEARRVSRNYLRLLRSLEVAESRADFAGKELEVATLRYQRGMANNLDVVNAELNLLMARSRLISIKAELALAWISTRAILGVLDPRQFIEESA